MHYRTLLKPAIKNPIPFCYVLNDVWYASAENILFIKNTLEKDFIVPSKSNRKLARSLADKLQGRYVRVNTLGPGPNVIFTVYLKGVDVSLMLVKQVFVNEDDRTGPRRVLFLDTAHFGLGTYLSIVWYFTWRFIASPARRQRFNVLCTMDAVTKEIFTVTNEMCINVTSVCFLLTQLVTHYVGAKITIVLDNAQYQKCELVLNHTTNLRIALLHLPMYSPHLNLIEHFWRYVCKECWYSKHYPKFEGFKQALVD